MSENLFEQYKAALRRGHMAALAGDLQEALAAYDAAAGLVPERALPLASRGTVLHRLDRWPEAAEAFERALQLAPDDEAALRARASARAERGLRSGAAADFERLASLLDATGRAGPAADAARRAVDLEPSDARTALADRLGAAAAMVANVAPPHAPAEDNAAALEDPWSAAVDERRLDRLAGDHPGGEADPGERESVGLDAAGSITAPDAAGPSQTQPGEAATTQPVLATTAIDGSLETGEEGDTGGAWPGIDLPSPPPAPIEGPPPDPEDLLLEAALVLEQGEVDAARDLMLTAARVHRDAGRIDAALEICLNLLTIAPGDPRVHLAIANLQLDRGWTGVATEKIDLLVRLTSLTGDTQAEADVHGLASERLRDEPAGSPASR